jgi:hypothetical protein
MQSNRELLSKCDTVHVESLKRASDRFRGTKLDEAVKSLPVYQLASVVRSEQVADCMGELHPMALRDVGQWIEMQLKSAADKASKALAECAKHFYFAQTCLSLPFCPVCFSSS